MAQTKWLKELEEKLNRLSPQQKHPRKDTASIDLYAQKPDNGKSLSLWVLIMFLCVSLAVVWRVKSPDSNSIAQRQWDAFNNSSVQPPVQPTQPTQLQISFAELKRQYEEIDAKAEKMWEKTQWNTKRITLLGIINNNNWVVTKERYSRHDLIFLNADWTINQWPKHLDLDESDIEFLRPFVNSEE
jgi:hypothetical protein